jgi:hypothetical protein
MGYSLLTCAKLGLATTAAQMQAKLFQHRVLEFLSSCFTETTATHGSL